MDADTVWSSDTPRILVADPDANVRSLYQDSFARCGCDVLEALDGRDALAKALVREPTLVITELRLPLLDGFSLCEILRRDRVTATVPIIALTTQPEPTDIVRAQDAGADIVLPKPAPFKKLLSEFSSLVARFGELRAKSEAARIAAS